MGTSCRLHPPIIATVVTVLSRSEETGLSLGPAPGFGPDGTWPPEVTEWVPLHWQLFETRNTDLTAAATYMALGRLWRPKPTSNPIFKDDALQDDFLREFFTWVPRHLTAYRSKGPSITVQLSGRDVTTGGRYPPAEICDADSPELRRMVHSVRWRRKDPVIQLPPGSANETTYSLTTGLSIERSQTLANSLGLSLGSTIVGLQSKLSSQLEQQFSLKLSLTAEESMTSTIRLQNDTADCYRLFALWHKEYSITVTALDVSPFVPLILSDEAPGQHWRNRGSVQFVTEGGPHYTYARINCSLRC
jgi:hypothetical protein